MSEDILEEFQQLDDGEIKRRVVKKTTYELDEVRTKVYFFISVGLNQYTQMGRE